MAKHAQPPLTRKEGATEPTDATGSGSERWGPPHFVDVVDLDDVAVLEAAGDLGLADEARDRNSAIHVGKQPLQSKALVGDDVTDFEDGLRTAR